MARILNLCMEYSKLTIVYSAVEYNVIVKHPSPLLLFISLDYPHGTMKYSGKQREIADTHSLYPMNYPNYILHLALLLLETSNAVFACFQNFPTPSCLPISSAVK